MRRRLIPVVVIVVVLAAAWGGGWFWLAAWADAQAPDVLARDRGARRRRRLPGPRHRRLSLRAAASPAARPRSRSAHRHAGESRRRDRRRSRLRAADGGGRAGFAGARRIAARSEPAEMRWEDAGDRRRHRHERPARRLLRRRRLRRRVRRSGLAGQQVAAASAPRARSRPPTDGGTDAGAAFTDLGALGRRHDAAAVRRHRVGELSVPPRALLAGRAGLQAPLSARGIDVALESGGARVQAEGDDDRRRGRHPRRHDGAARSPAPKRSRPSSPRCRRSGRSSATRSVGGALRFRHSRPRSTASRRAS